MAKERRVPDYKKMYPTASEEVIAVLRQSERKMQYQEYDLKAERFVIDEVKQKAFFIPSREDSLERLIEAEVQFQDESFNLEEMVVKEMMIERLKERLELLGSDEFELIKALFYKGYTEREYSKLMCIPQKTINDRKNRIIRKLKKFLENEK